MSRHEARFFFVFVSGSFSFQLRYYVFFLFSFYPGIVHALFGHFINKLPKLSAILIDKRTTFLNVFLMMNRSIWK